MKGGQRVKCATILRADKPKRHARAAATCNQTASGGGSLECAEAADAEAASLSAGTREEAPAAAVADDCEAAAAEAMNGEFIARIEGESSSARY